MYRIINLISFVVKKSNNYITMSGQMKLDNFFKPFPKRKFSDTENNDTSNIKETTNINKKSKLTCSLETSFISNEVINEADMKLKSDESVNKVDNEKCELKTDEFNVEKTDYSSTKNSLTKTNVAADKIKSNQQLIAQKHLRAKIIRTSKLFPALHDNIGDTWFKALEPEFQKPYFRKLSSFLVAERQKKEIFPPHHQVWTWTNMCAMEEVKVVIIGQDPYHNPGQAHGLCFSVPKGVQPPPSLINMYQELAKDIEGFIPPKHGNLTGWARQGVLLLNAVLTVQCRTPNSHKDQGWEQLTTAVIKYLSENHKGIVFLLWGSYAQKKADVVDKKKHHLLKTVHPSPLSAHRGFFGSKHFSQCNKLLAEQGKSPINWANLPDE